MSDLKQRSWGRSGLAIVALLLVSVIICLSMADILMPQTGKKVQKNGELSVDCSHMDQGYIMVKAKKGKKKLKVRVKCGENALNYDLNTDGEYEVFPLQYGSGKYTITLYKNASGKKYSEEGKVSISPKMKDPNTCFLYPNQYINYDEKTDCVVAAADMCAGKTEQADIYKTITGYVANNFVYDFVKSVSVKAGVLPDIEGCWEKRMGICQDLSSMTIAMLRSQGVPAKLMIGTLGSGTYHAWVVAVVDGEDKFFDPTMEVNKSSKKETYTTERWY